MTSVICAEISHSLKTSLLLQEAISKHITETEVITCSHYLYFINLDYIKGSQRSIEKLHFIRLKFSTNLAGLLKIYDFES